MIKSIEHANQIQRRREAAGKFGYAKAVRRYLKNHHGSDYKKEKGKLVVSWPEQDAEEAAA